MQTILILQPGERRPVDRFVADPLAQAAEGAADALDALDHAQCHAVDIDAPEASRLNVSIRQTAPGWLTCTASADTVAEKYRQPADWTRAMRLPLEVRRVPLPRVWVLPRGFRCG
jgi:hypothetical protein